MENGSDSRIAVIGMACRFPGARNVDEFWRNLCNGVESISFFTDEELLASGVDPALLTDHNYVKAGAILEGAEYFDAAFFGCSPREAELMDPQHRLFLECAWEALEDAGYDSETFNGSIGVYAGSTMSTYLYNLYSNHEFQRDSSVGSYVGLGNDLAFLTTRVCYKLNLKGPSYPIQTACSTSLVAIHVACQSLLSYECRMALAGGVSIRFPHKVGYTYQQDGILSPDGHCRAFDAKARGTIFGRGVGIVVLKRLDDALADGDCIHAVIKGSAVNNDGSLKASFTAPSVSGQAEVIEEALANAEVEAESISFIETHGSGTSLGDSIELSALLKAFRVHGDKKRFCAIGSVKTNIGHLDAAAGIAGFIKTVLALKHKLMPPSLHFEQLNPDIDFANSPFYVNSQLSEWNSNGHPCRAGISSFGFGGTNAHVIVEEAPVAARSGESREWQLLVLSAKTPLALEIATKNLLDHLRQNPDQGLSDIAYTLQVGRRPFIHRRALVCRDLQDAVNALAGRDPQRVFTANLEKGNPSVAFMLSGQGSQYVDMGRGLYQAEPVFREQIEQCSSLLKLDLGFDLREVLYPKPDQVAEAARLLNQTYVTQLGLFVTEYALARLLMRWGVRPQAMIGHSIGEYVAACLAGVFTLEDGLKLVAARGRLMQELPTGAMLAVAISEEKISPLLDERLSVAAVNGPSRLIVSGPTDAIEALEVQLTEKGRIHRRLPVSHAFHSPMMESIVEPLRDVMRAVRLAPPRIAYISNVTGTWIRAEEATDPNYWADHLRSTVRFAEGISELLKESERVLLEVGPGKTLSSLAAQQVSDQSRPRILASLRSSEEDRPDQQVLLTTVGNLWLNGLQIDWPAFHAAERCHRLSLPTYPFERQRYWIEAKAVRKEALTSHSAHTGHPLLDRLLLKTIDQEIYLTEFSDKRHWVVRQHKIAGHYAVPGTTYLEMVREAGSRYLGDSVTCLANVEFQTLLILKENEARTVHTIIREKGKDLEFKVVSCSSPTDSAEDCQWTLHVKGSINRRASGQPGRYAVSEIERACHEELVIERASDSHEVMEYGPRWHNIKSIRANDNQALAFLELPEEFAADTENYDLHPALLDMATTFFGSGLKNDFYLPLAYEELRIYGSIPRQCFSYARGISGFEEDQELRKVDVDILNVGGKVVVEIKGFTQKKLHQPWKKMKELAERVPLYHEIRWQRSEDESEPQGNQDGGCLVFHDEEGIGSEISQYLRDEGRLVIGVKFGGGFERLDAQSYIIQSDEQDYERLFDEIPLQRISQIVHFSSIIDREAADLSDLERALDCGVYSLFKLIKALSRHRLTQKFELVLVAKYVNEVTGEEKAIYPDGACLFGLAKVVEQEFQGLRCRWIDIDEATGVEKIVEGLKSTDEAKQVAYRKGERYVAELRRAHLVSGLETRVRIKDEGVYVITGGLGALGLETARYLSSENPRVTLALINRSPMPSRQEWDRILQDSQDESMTQRIRVIREIEARGASVGCFSADVSNPAEAHALLSALRERYGRINGVIHAAGIAGDGFIINKTAESFKQTLAPKVIGSWILDSATRDDHLDFFIVFSSTASLVGSPGQSDYTSANLYLDSFAVRRHKEGKRTTSINWTAWKEKGMAAHDGLKLDRGLFKSISSDEAVDAFRAILNASPARVIVGEINYSFADELPLGEWNRITGALPFVLSDEIVSGFHRNRMGYRQHRRVENTLIPDVVIKGRDAGAYTEMERALAGIWAKELGLKEVNILDDFYRLGGDSLIALRIANSIDKDLNKPVRITDLFEHLTIAGLARHLCQSLIERGEGQSAGKRGEDGYDLSPAQKAIWLLQKLHPQDNLYNLPNFHYVRHELDLEKFNAAVEALLLRHSSLRTVFRHSNGKIRQFVLNNLTPLVEFLDLSQDQNQEELIEGLITEDNGRVFDLSQPLIRGKVFKLAEKCYGIYFNFHHIVADGWSTGIFFDELRRVYAALVEGKSVDLYPLELEYIDYVEGQKRWIESEECREMERYWLRELSPPLPRLRLPKTKTQGVRAFDVLSFNIDAPETERIKGLCYQLGLTLNMLLLSVYFLSLKTLTGDEDIIVGVPFSNRDDKELEKVIGLFVNSVCIRMNLSSLGTFRAFAMEVRDKSLDAYRNSKLPFELALEKLNPERDLSRHPIFSTMFQVTEFIPPTHQLPQIEILLACKEEDGGIHMRLSFNRTHVSERTIERLAMYFLTTMRIVLESPDHRYLYIEEKLRECERTQRAMRAKDIDGMSLKKMELLSRKPISLSYGES